MKKKMNFEDSLARLEKITLNLENGDLPLDESLKIFEEGIKLSRFCEKKLTEAEKKLEILKSIDIEELENPIEKTDTLPEDNEQENPDSFLF